MDMLAPIVRSDAPLPYLRIIYPTPRQTGHVPNSAAGTKNHFFC
jgi:hypothetical protein